MKHTMIGITQITNMEDQERKPLIEFKPMSREYFIERTGLEPSEVLGEDWKEIMSNWNENDQ